MLFVSVDVDVVVVKGVEIIVALIVAEVVIVIVVAVVVDAVVVIVVIVCSRRFRLVRHTLSSN